MPGEFEPGSRYVMLHIGVGPSRTEEQGGLTLVTTDGDPFQLRDDLWIERLDEEVAKHVLQACEPPHYNIGTTPYDRHLYAFVRRVPVEEKTNYEGMDVILATAALSRLIHPTSIGTRYCAKIFNFDAQESPINAIPFRGLSPDVFLSANSRDWLTKQEGKELLKLMPWLEPGKPMLRRVHRAYWNHEYAMRSYYLDQRWIMVVSGLESLLSVGPKDPSGQFQRKVQRLSAEFTVDLSGTDLKNAYKLRSKLVHAEGFLSGLDTVLPQSEHRDLYERLEILLRSTILRALVEQEFGGSFEDDKAVATRWGD